MPLDECIDPGSVEPAPLTQEEIPALGEAADAAIESLAGGVVCGPEVAALSALLCLENRLLSGIGAPAVAVDFTAMLAPVLDRIVPHVAPSSELRTVRQDDVVNARKLLSAAEIYTEVTYALTRAMQGRMEIRRTRDGRLLVTPSGSVQAELRLRWFDRKWRLGRDVAPPIGPANFVEVALKVDEHIERHRGDVLSGVYSVPTEDWYVDYVTALVDAWSEETFAHVEPSEVWAGFTVEDMKKGLRPIRLRAARRFFAHTRARTWLADRNLAGTRLLTAVERVAPGILLTEMVAGGLSDEKARHLVAGLERCGTGERFRLESYPLVPLPGGDVVFMPSCILRGNWSMIREKVAVRDARDRQLGDLRVKRHVAAVTAVLKSVPGVIGTDVNLVEPGGRTLTDLDVVLVDAHRQHVLVVQLKSFVTPMNFLEFDRADKDIAEAVEQCRLADRHRDLAKQDIERRTSVRLEPQWVLRQLVVTEIYTGSRTSDPDYPVVSLDWLKGEGPHALQQGGVELLYDMARTLLDGQDFFANYRPGLREIPDGTTGLRLGATYLVWDPGNI